MQSLRLWVAALIGSTSLGWSQPATTDVSKPVVREWTSVDGKKISAEYLGIQGDNVALKLQGGKLSMIPLVRLSAQDKTFTRENALAYHPAWQAWPPHANYAMQNVPVAEAPGKDGTFVYTTPHFRFHSDVNLGTPLMKDLARVFELTYQLQSKSPFGILAKPEDGLFNAKLFGSVFNYMKAGGLPGTAGIYLLKEKVFMAPLDLMGVRAGAAGWRKDSAEYDVTTIVHELTHMLTDEMLNNLPLWVNEGYAEYISNIPLEKGAVHTSNEKIREGVLNMLVRQNGDSSSGSRSVVGNGERVKLQKSNGGPPLRKVADVLQMTNEEWITGRKPGSPDPESAPRTNYDPEKERLRLPILYRTSHLIIYYLIQIEGEKGVLKIRRFLDENRKYMASYLEYRAAFTEYETKMEAFMKLPGVSKKADGRIHYPEGLEIPVEPKLPFTDPNKLNLGGLDALLAGESAAVVGARIEDALRKDLGVKLRFE